MPKLNYGENFNVEPGDIDAVIMNENLSDASIATEIVENEDPHKSREPASRSKTVTTKEGDGQDPKKKVAFEKRNQTLTEK